MFNSLKYKFLFLIVALLSVTGRLCAQGNGSSQANAITIPINASGTTSYLDTKYNGSGFADLMGNPNPEIYYRFTLPASGNVSVSHCGSGFDTFMYILDQSGAVVASNDDNFSSPCPGSQAYIEVILNAGTYYIVSEGYDTNTGNISTGLNVVIAENCQGIINHLNSTQNYVLTSYPRTAVSDISSFANLGVCQLARTVEYMDGLGRTVQNIMIQGSPSFSDLVLPVYYDQNGSSTIKYDAYTVADNGGNYRPSALSSEIQAFYNNPIAGRPVNNFPFGLTRTDKSPLNRPVEQGASGPEWQPALGDDGHTKKIVYGTNSFNEVRNWVTGSDGASSGFYAAGTLYKYISKDENWKPLDEKAGTVEEFKDLEGKLILKKAWLTNNTSSDTYFVYDDFNHLRYVIPPALNSPGPTFKDSFVESESLFGNFVYAYRYDGKGRIIERKIPGKGWESIVYNSLDQPVFIQDAVENSQHLWEFIKYDDFGRVIISGIYNAASDRQQLQNAVDMQFTLWETRDDQNSSGSGTGYTNSAFPVDGISEYTSINYYDDYSFYNNSFGQPVGDGLVGSERTVSLLTGIKKKVLGTNQWLLTVGYYDKDGRIVKAKSQNHLNNGQDVVDNSYNFAGNLLTSKRTHTANGQLTVIATAGKYDHVGRPVQLSENINSQGEVVISKFVYNELGDLITKNLHGGNGNSFLQSVNFSYNERGWLKSLLSDKFSQSLKYTQSDGLVSSSPNYNGNISEQHYNGEHSGTRSFGYAYDKLNRLTASSYSNASALSENVSYDLMGNIISLDRGGTGNPINYVYKDGNKSNQLDYVGGAVSGSFVYDTNGNLTQDGTKNGTAFIIYNHLNLPTTISGSISAGFAYDSDGNKLSSLQGGIARDYVDGIQYENGAIASILTSEGRAVRNQSNGVYRYEYNLMDHQGNVRVSIDDQGNNVARVIQEDEYSAFGFRKAGGYLFGDKNNYLYNGKEFQEVLGEYDYGARLYNPVIARWNGSDPLADNFPHVSSYNYVYNNPVNFNDPTGMAALGWILGADQVTMTYDPNVNSQSDVTNGGTYLGPHGYGINTRTGNTIYYRGDGSQISGVQQLSDVNVSAKGPSMGSQVLNVAIGFTPVLGSVRDIYQGARDGNYLQLALGVGGLALDISSLGTSSIVKGGLKTLGKELLEEGAEAGLKQAAMGGAELAEDAIKLTTSSKSLAASRTYTIYDGSGQLYKFGVTGANLKRYEKVLSQAGPGAYGKFSSVMAKSDAHVMEKYLRSLHFNSTGQYALPGMKVPFPANFTTGFPIKF